MHPGSIDTPMVEAALEGLKNVNLKTNRDRDAARIALGLGEPDDVAYAVLFLASDESKHVTGAEWVIDNADSVS